MKIYINGIHGFEIGEKITAADNYHGYKLCLDAKKGKWVFCSSFKEASEMIAAKFKGGRSMPTGFGFVADAETEEVVAYAAPNGSGVCNAKHESGNSFYINQI